MTEKPEPTGREPDEKPSPAAPPETKEVAPGDAAPEGAAEAPADVTDDGDTGAGKSEEGGGPPAKPEESDKEPESGRYVIQARYGALPVIGMATVTDSSIPKSVLCVIRTKRGTEIGTTLGAARPADGDVGETIGHVLRRATTRDIERQRKIENELEPEELKYCRQKIGERSLRMRLSSVEHVWGGERIIYHFTAERRVDFRALVRDLAWHFHTRIELRQIGARDEARLLADYEHCGQPLCCKTFLRSLEPVTMRMAKLQRTTLDPSKISGRCGRLMCCLRFEDAVYRELKKGLPQRGTRVAVGSDEGVVVSTEILTQEVTVRLADGRIVRAPVGDLRPPRPAGEAPAETEKAGAAPAKAEQGRAAPASPAEKGRPSRPSGPSGSSGGGEPRKTRRRGRPQGAKKGPAATDGAQPSGQTKPSARPKPARGRKGRRRGGRNQRTRPKGTGEGGGGGGGDGGGKSGGRAEGRPPADPGKDARPEG